MKKLLPLVILLILSSCSGLLQEPALETDKGQDAAPSKYAVSIEDAVKIAEKYRSEISEGTGSTRSFPAIKSIETIKNHKTRSIGDSGIENYFYLINYAEDGGFALLGADTRMAPLYAISDEGHLSMQDTVWNPGLSAMINSYINQANGDDVVSPVDSLITKPIPPYVDVELGMEEYKVNPPVLARYVRMWHQSAPFNKYTPEKYNPVTGQMSHTLVGCVPLAIGMIMSYYEYPDAYMGYSYNWPAMKTGGSDEDVAHLLASLGKPNNLNSDYELGSTGTYESSIAGTLKNFKYESAKGSQRFSTTANHQLYDVVKPILVLGTVDNPASGHAWVVDGSIWHHIPVEGNIGDLTYNDYRYLHCVWGWRGDGNGYYLFDGRTLGGKSYDTAPDEWVSLGIKYTFNLGSFWSDIKPIK